MGRPNSLHLAAAALLLAVAGSGALGGLLANPPAADAGAADSAVASSKARALGSDSVIYSLYSQFAEETDDDLVDNSTCAYLIMQQYSCSEPACADLVPGEWMV